MVEPKIKAPLVFTNDALLSELNAAYLQSSPVFTPFTSTMVDISEHFFKSSGNSYSVFSPAKPPT